MTLANLPADSKTPDALLDAAGKYGFHVYMRPAYLCAQVELGAGDQRQELKASLLSKKKLRRYLRAMEREGPVKFAHLQSPEQIQAAFGAAGRRKVLGRSWFALTEELLGHYAAVLGRAEKTKVAT